MTRSDAALKTDCKWQPLLFQDLGLCKLWPIFPEDTSAVTAVFCCYAKLDSSIGLTRSLSRCFRDGRDARFVEHELDALISQRVPGLAAGYEHLNDHNHLRLDPLFAVAVGKVDPLGTRRAERDRGKALASSPTLNAARRTGRPFFPWLLSRVLLFATLLLCRRCARVCKAAHE